MGLLLASLHRVAGALSWEQEEGPCIHFLFEVPHHVQREPIQTLRPWARAAGQRARAWAAAGGKEALAGAFELARHVSFGAYRDTAFIDKGLLQLVQTGSM